MKAVKLYNKKIPENGISQVYEGIVEVEMVIGAVNYLNLIERMENIAGEHETQAILDTLEDYGIAIRSTTFQ